MKKAMFLLLFLLIGCVSAEVKVLKDISYKPNASAAYEKERCKLDVYLTGKDKSPVIVWFHGGGLQAGSKDKVKEVVTVAQKFAAHGVAFVAVNYRLSPKVKYPVYIDDAAASIKWTTDNADKYGFDKSKIFVGGHSAGGYLTLMTSFTNSSTEKCGLNVNDIAGILPYSGQTVTHSTVRKESGISKNAVLADERSPVYNSSKMKLPAFITTGDNDLKMRAEENLLLYSAIKSIRSQTKFRKFTDRNHVSLVTRMVEKNDPVFKESLQFINSLSKK